jgi:hypothetical protein
MHQHEIQQLNIYLNMQIIEYYSFWKNRVLHAHFPFFSPFNIFFISSNIRKLTLSTAPFDCGRYTNAKATFVTIWWHNSLNIALLKYFALSTVACLGTL